MTDTTHIAGGRTTPVAAIVTCDQVTILGDGTSVDPIRLVSVGVTSEFQADFTSSLPFTPVVGTPVIVAPDETANPANANTDVFAVGLITAIDDSGILPRVTVRTSGTVVLTADEWDEVTGQVGGLTSGSLYFLDDVSNGGLETTAPSASGTFVCQVGVAINATTLLLSTPVFPRENP